MRAETRSCYVLFNISCNKVVFFFSWRDSPLVELGLLLIHEDFCGFFITHNDAPQSVGLLWTSDQLVAETSDNTQHSQQTNIHAPGGIRTHDLSRRAAVYLRLRLRGHCCYVCIKDSNRSALSLYCITDTIQTYYYTIYTNKMRIF